MADRIEIVPTNLAEDDRRMQRPLCKRPHFVRKVDGNGQTEWTKQSYSNRSNAKRSVTRDGTLRGLPIVTVTPQEGAR